MRALAQQLTDGFFQNTHAVAVNDTHAIHGSERGGVDEFIHLFHCFFRALAYYVQLAIGDVPAWTRFKAYVPGQLRLRCLTGNYFQNVFARHLHFHKAGFHFHGAVLQ